MKVEKLSDGTQLVYYDASSISLLHEHSEVQAITMPATFI